MKILITGSKGNIGRLLVSRLEKDHEIFGIDIVRDVDRNYLVRDITDGIFDVCYRFQPELIIHLAAIVSRITCEQSPALTIKTNVLGTQNIIDACLETGCRLMFFSTSEVYGNLDEPMSEDIELQPNNIYGISKKIGEDLVRYYLPDAAIIRPFMAYHEREPYGQNRSAMIRFIHDLMDGKTIEVHKGSQRQWIHMDDVINIIDHLIHSKGTYNIGNSNIINTIDLARMIHQRLGTGRIKEVPLPEKMTLIKEGVFDRQNYRCKIDIETGIERVINYVRNQRGI